MGPSNVGEGKVVAMRWHDKEKIRPVFAHERVHQAFQWLLEGQIDWAVILGSPSARNLLYVLNEDEVHVLWEALRKADWFKAHTDVLGLTLHEVFKLDLERSSTPVPYPRPDRVELIGARGVTARRAVLFDAEGQPISVGTPPDETPHADAAAVRDLIRYDFRFEEGEEADIEYAEMVDPELDLGPPFQVGAPPPEEAPPPSERTSHRFLHRPQLPTQKVPVTLSGSAPGQAGVGEVFTVRFRIEWQGDAAQPLEKNIEAEIAPDENLRVMLMTKGDALQPTGNRVQDVPPPTKDVPVEGSFNVAVVEAGGGQPAELALMFFQGGSHLGSLPFTVRIVTVFSRHEIVERHTEAAPRVRADDEVLIWIIAENRNEEGLRRYEHHLVGVDLGQFRDFSNPIQDSGKGFEAMRTAYLKRTYERVLQPVRTRDDVERLQVRVRTAGTSLCRMLIDPEVTRKLWDWRDKIQTIRVHSYDPLIPWELVRLQHPDTREVDDHYLAEYGLVRWLPNLAPASAMLRLDRWRYLAATYPHGSASSVQGEVEYFTRDLPAHGMQASQIEPTLEGVLATLETDRFDVLHLACHGESNLERVESVRLLIGDRRAGNGAVELEVVEASDVVPSVNFSTQPGPIVFLTACEGGQAAPSLTDWEGWPHAFLKGGASVFVGTSWSVRAKPAYAFSRAFYDALLDGKNLASAAVKGRQAAKQLGDASWLAYKVYGHPLARRV